MFNRISTIYALKTLKRVTGGGDSGSSRSFPLVLRSEVEMNKQIAVAMTVAMAVFLTAACIGASTEDTDAAGPYDFTVDYEDYSISFNASEPASEGVKGTARITNVTINEGSTNVDLDLPETVARSDSGYEGFVYDVTGIGIENYGMVIFSTEDGADNIRSISMPDTYTWLASQAFVYCSNLESVKLSAGLESIPEQTFSKITQIGISSSGEPYIDVVAPGTKITSIDIPEGIKTIGTGAFRDCPTLTHVSIPSTVTEIQQEAFRNTGLTTVEIKAADPSIERSIGDSAFASNSNLVSINIPEGFTSIDVKAFQNCKSITEVTIPGTMEQMYGDVFDKCTSLETVTFSGVQPPIIPSGTFGTDVKFIVPEGSETTYQAALDTATGGAASINDYVAKVGEDKFLTIQAAIDSIATSGTVTLLKETTVETTISISTDKDITLDLGGFSIDGSTVNGFVIDNDGILLIIGNGTIKANSEIKSSTGAVNNDGTLTLDGVSISDGYYAVQNVGSTIIEDANVSGSKFGVSNRLSSSNLLIENGEFVCTLGAVHDAQKGAIEIKDGKFEATGGAAVTTSGKLTIWDGTFEGSTYAISTQYNAVKDSVKILGGTFTGTNGAVNSTGSAKGSIGITGGSFSSDVTNLCTDGYAPTQDGDSWVVKIDDESKLVAEIDGKGFTSLVDAIGMAGDGDIITLLKDTTESITVVTGKDVTLDLGIYKLTNTDGHHTIAVQSGATLTIQGTGTVDNVSHQKAAIFNEEGGTVILAGGSYTRCQEAGSTSSDSGNNSYYNILNQGTMTIKAGVIVSQNGVYSSLIDNGWYDTSGMTGDHEAKLTIEGGTFTGGKYTIKNDEYGIVEIKDGTFTNTAQAPIMNCNEMTISGGTFDGNSSNYILVNFQYSDETSTGNLQIDGGNFEGKNGITDAGYSGRATIAISKGDFEVVGAMFNFTASEPEVTVSGGTFNKTFDSKYMAPGFILEGNDEDGYGVSESVTVTFDMLDGTEDVTRTIVKGATVTDLPQAPAGYAVSFTSNGSVWDPANPVEKSITVIVTYVLNAPELSIVSVAEGTDATITVTPTSEAQSVSYVYAVIGPDGVLFTPADKIFTTQYPGTYTVTVKATGEYGYAEATGTVDVTFEIQDMEANEVFVDVDYGSDSASITIDGIDLEIAGASHGNVHVVIEEVDSVEIDGHGVSDLTYEITVAGSGINDDEVITITVPIDVPVGQRIASDSAAVLFVPTEGDAEDMDAYIGDDGKSIVFTTTHNSKYAVFYDLEAIPEDDPSFNPYPGDDDDYVPLPPTIVYEDDGSDSTASIAACAAAAVVAAILAIVLASTYRRK